MAPTEILSQQHFEGLSKLLKDLPVRVEVLTGSTKTAARKRILAAALDGSLDILIGTHALIEQKVQFAGRPSPTALMLQGAPACLLIIE
jgi:ATP-dependent DNA helicase RecG